MRHVRRGMALGTALMIGCAGAAEPERAAAPGVHVGVPEAARAVLPGWAEVDPAWFAAAEVWLIAGFAEGTYPCVQNGDELDMIASHSFTPTRVLRGEVQAPAIDVRAYDLKGASYPRALAVGREYLVLLRPSEATRRLLADPRAVFSMMTALGPDEVIAVVDLSRVDGGR